MHDLPHSLSRPAMTAAEYGSPYEAADMCLGSQLDTAPVPDTPLLASSTEDEHDDRIPVYIEVICRLQQLQRCSS